MLVSPRFSISPPWKLCSLRRTGRSGPFGRPSRTRTSGLAVRSSGTRLTVGLAVPPGKRVPTGVVTREAGPDSVGDGVSGAGATRESAMPRRGGVGRVATGPDRSEVGGAVATAVDVTAAPEPPSSDPAG